MSDNLEAEVERLRAELAEARKDRKRIRTVVSHSVMIGPANPYTQGWNDAVAKIRAAIDSGEGGETMNDAYDATLGAVPDMPDLDGRHGNCAAGPWRPIEQAEKYDHRLLLLFCSKPLVRYPIVGYWSVRDSCWRSVSPGGAVHDVSHFAEINYPEAEEQ